MDQFPEDQVWAALYLALGAEVGLGEILRHVTPDLLGKLNDFRLLGRARPFPSPTVPGGQVSNLTGVVRGDAALSEIEVELAAVLDCRDPNTFVLVADDLPGITTST